MTGEDHLIGLGKLVGNLHALELLLRIFLCEAKGEKLNFPQPGTASLGETHLTNYDSLDKIVAKYNAGLSRVEQQYRIDPSVVKVRDVIAHGRLTALSAEFPLTLCKFGKANHAKQVPVEYLEVLSVEWFEKNRALLFSQIENVKVCSKSRSYKFVMN